MKLLILTLVTGMALFTTSSFTPAGNPGETFTEEFHFYTNDGCGEYFVSGTMTIRYNGNEKDLISYEGTAVSMATGEETPLHVRSVSRITGNSLFFMTNGVFPGVMQFHYQTQVKFEPEFKLHINDFSHCIQGNQ
jgi:hypothetical protein